MDLVSSQHHVTIFSGYLWVSRQQCESNFMVTQNNVAKRCGPLWACLKDKGAFKTRSNEFLSWKSGGALVMGRHTMTHHLRGLNSEPGCFVICFRFQTPAFARKLRCSPEFVWFASAKCTHLCHWIIEKSAKKAGLQTLLLPLLELFLGQLQLLKGIVVLYLGFQ